MNIVCREILSGSFPFRKERKELFVIQVGPFCGNLNGAATQKQSSQNSSVEKKTTCIVVDGCISRGRLYSLHPALLRPLVELLHQLRLLFCVPLLSLLLRLFCSDPAGKTCFCTFYNCNGIYCVTWINPLLNWVENTDCKNYFLRIILILGFVSSLLYEIIQQETI